MMDEKYESVYVAFGSLDAQSVKLFLESNGIEAFVSQESAGLTYGLTIGPLGKAEVYVPVEQAEFARHILEMMEEGEFDVEEGEEEYPSPDDVESPDEENVKP
jgi:hypothetical protein